MGGEWTRAVRVVPARRTVRAMPAAPPPLDDAAVARGVRLGIVAYVIWGLLTIYWKQLAEFDPFELIAWRMVCAAIVMAVIVTARRSWPTITAAFRDPGTALRLVLASLLLTVNWGCYVWAVTAGHVVETALGYFIAPLATMLIGVLVLHERATSGQWFAFGCASVAVVILTVSSGRPPLIALAIAASWSTYGLTKRRVALGSVDSLAGETFVLFVPAVIAALAFASRADSIPATATPTEWVLVFGTGIATAVPLMLFATAARSIPFTLLGPLNLLVPVINFGLGWLVYDESVPFERMIGFGFVWLALVVVMWDRVRDRQRDPELAPTG